MSHYTKDKGNIRECYIPSALLCASNGAVVGVVDVDGSSLKWFTSDAALKDSAVRVSNQGRRYVESDESPLFVCVHETTCSGARAEHLQEVQSSVFLKVGVQNKGQVILTDMREPGVQYVVPFGPQLERLELGKIYQLARDANRFVVGVAYNLVLDAGKLVKASTGGRLLDTGLSLSEKEFRALDVKLATLGAFSALDSEKRLPSSKALSAEDWLKLLPNWLDLQGDSVLMTKLANDYFLVASTREHDMWYSGYLSVCVEDGLITLRSTAHDLDLVAQSWSSAADILADFFGQVSIIQYGSWLELASYRQFFG